MFLTKINFFSWCDLNHLGHCSFDTMYCCFYRWAVAQRDVFLGKGSWPQQWGRSACHLHLQTLRILYSAWHHGKATHDPKARPTQNCVLPVLPQGLQARRGFEVSHESLPQETKVSHWPWHRKRFWILIVATWYEINTFSRSNVHLVHTKNIRVNYNYCE